MFSCLSFVLLSHLEICLGFGYMLHSTHGNIYSYMQHVIHIYSYILIYVACYSYIFIYTHIYSMVLIYMALPITHSLPATQLKWQITWKTERPRKESVVCSVLCTWIFACVCVCGISICVFPTWVWRWHQLCVLWCRHTGCISALWLIHMTVYRGCGAAGLKHGGLCTTAVGICRSHS